MHLPKILLLDCSKKIADRLLTQGFNLSRGTVGYATGIRKLPHQIYESEVIIYNPKARAQDSYSHRPLSKVSIENETPQFSINHVHDFLKRGGIIVTFVNHNACAGSGRDAYEWIPDMSDVHDTHDEQVFSQKNEGVAALLRPMLNVSDVKRPVLHSLRPRQSSPMQSVVALFRNRISDLLGIVYAGESGGLVLVLPEFKDNDEVIKDFLHRVWPHFIPETKTDVVTSFISPSEGKGLKKIEKLATILEKTEKRHDQSQAQLAKASRLKVKKITSDETASRMIRYYNTALENPDHALFYLDKVTEAVDKKFGSEKKAKAVIGENAAWNRIGTAANDTYDVRHVPKPGMKLQEPTEEVIKQSFEDAQTIIHAYFKTLF